MHRYPTLEELGEYTEPFLAMAGFYITAQILFGDRRWFLVMERQCMIEATDVDLIMDVQHFVELFWMAMHDWDFALCRELNRFSWGWLHVR